MAKKRIEITGYFVFRKELLGDIVSPQRKDMYGPFETLAEVIQLFTYNDNATEEKFEAWLDTLDWKLRKVTHHLIYDGS